MPLHQMLSMARCPNIDSEILKKWDKVMEERKISKILEQVIKLAYHLHYFPISHIDPRSRVIRRTLTFGAFGLI